MSDEQTEWIFTFGRAYNLRDNYVRVSAPSYDEARATFVAARALAGELKDSHRRWAFQYPASKADEFEQKYGMTEVPIHTPIRWADDSNPVE